MVGERPAAEETALATYGDNLGIAFQLIDDALDYSAQPGAAGQERRRRFPRGQDHPAGAGRVCRAAATTERAFWRRVLEDLEQQPGDLEHAQELIARHGAIEATVARAEAYAHRARQGLGTFPYSRAKQAMLDLLDFCIARAY